MARPSILTPELIERICEGLREGLPVRQACAGIIVESTYYDWISRAPEGGLYAEFSEATQKAIEDGFRSLAVVVVNGAKTDPKLALEVLARRDHEHWGRRDRRTVEAKVVHSGNVLHGATDAQLSALLDKFGIVGDD